MLRHFFSRDDVGNHRAPPCVEREKFPQKEPFGFRFDQVQNAIGNHHVDGSARNQRMSARKSCARPSEGQKGGRIGDRPRFQLASSNSRSSARSWMRPLRNSTFAIADPLRHDRRVPARHREHVVGHVHPDNPSLGLRPPGAAMNKFFRCRSRDRAPSRRGADTGWDRRSHSRAR